MKYLLLSAALAMSAPAAFAQKPPIDSSLFGRWPSVGSAKISNDGNYALYGTGFSSHFSWQDKMLFLQATNSPWSMEIPAINPNNVRFSSDSKLALFTDPGDSLCIVRLGTSAIEYIPHVPFFTLAGNSSHEWLAYRRDTGEKALTLRNMKTGRERVFDKTTDFQFIDEGRILLLQTPSIKDSGITLQWLDLSDEQIRTIWEGPGPDNFTYNAGSAQLAFTADKQPGEGSGNALWLYKAGAAKAIMLADDHSPGMTAGWRIDGIQGFSNDGRRIYFMLKQPDQPRIPDSNAVKVDIWSYTDIKLQSQQLTEANPASLNHPASLFTAVIDIGDRQVIRLGGENERLLAIPSDENDPEQVGLMLRYMRGDFGERNWNPAARYSYYLLSTRTGKPIQKNGKIVEFGSSGNPDLSPGGKFLIYFDKEDKNHYSYALASGIIRNITRDIHTDWTEYGNDRPDAALGGNSLSGWLQGDTTVLLHDQNDIWQVSLTGGTPPVNLTNGYGRKHNIEFRPALGYPFWTVPSMKKLLLTAFNRETKDNGFYNATFGKARDPELLTMGPYAYEARDIGGVPGDPPIKARDTDAWLVKRQSATESPNYFFSRDLKTLTPLSHIYPEKKYNWLSTELVNWTTSDGSPSQGVLYKPENFDPNKKYPLVLYYYELQSDRLHVYQQPEASFGPMNIPWFVSNGYLVFTPDIHYKIGEIGPGAYNAIVSAVQYLSHRPYVDTRHMGIQGHSFGGYETLYVVTHTGMFAAAMAAAGPSDLISDYGSIWGVGRTKQEWAELTQGRMNATLSQRPDLYIANSPVFNADKVTTPLLLLYNKNDDGVAFSQGIEIFTALRRLGKKSWMLQYDGEEHMILDDKASRDFQVRIAQFFDHYLKGTPPPEWMTRGRPASLKGIDDGLKLDMSGKQP